MELDFTTILYILFGLLYFAFTSASKNKKKREQQGPSNTRPEDQSETLGPPPVSRKPTFEELLEEFTTGKKSPEPEPFMAETVDAVEDDDKPLFDSWYEEDRSKLKKKSSAPATESSFERFEEFETQEQARSKYRDLLRNSNGARDALVLKEILDRKY